MRTFPRIMVYFIAILVYLVLKVSFPDQVGIILFTVIGFLAFFISEILEEKI